MQGVREAKGLSPKVRDVPDLFQNACAQGADPGCDEIKLVEVNGC